MKKIVVFFSGSYLRLGFSSTAEQQPDTTIPGVDWTKVTWSQILHIVGMRPCDIMAEYTRTFYENGHNFKKGILGNGRFNLLQTLGNGEIYLILCHTFVLSDWYVLNVGYSMLYFSLCTCKHNLCQYTGV